MTLLGTRHPEPGRFVAVLLCAAMAVGLMLGGCATSGGDGGEFLGQASRPAWSMKLAPPHLVVAVSPVRQTLQLAGSFGTVIGAGITAVQNAQYRGDIEEALGDYDSARVVEDRAAEAIAAVLDGKGTRVEAFEWQADGGDVREATHARYRRLAKSGHDQVLDVFITHGVYGVYGDLAVRLRAELHAVPSGQLLWKDTITVRGGPPLAYRSLGDPMRQLKPNITAPRLSSKEDAVSQWTEDNGARFKAEFERVLSLALEGLKVATGGAETPDGLLALGAGLMYQKRFADAHELLEKAKKCAPDRLDILNTASVNLGHYGQVDDAIALAGMVVDADATNAAAHLNLAWWYAMEKQDLLRSRPHYEEAIRLGMSPIRKLEKRLEPEVSP